MTGSGWDDFIKRIAKAEQSRRGDPVGDAIWMIIATAVALTLLGVAMKSVGWL